MNNFQQLVKELEKEYLLILIKELRADNLSLQLAKEKTKAFLNLLPFLDVNDLKVKIDLFCQKNPEFSGINLFLRRKEEEEKTKIILERMRSLIKRGKIDEALTMAKN